MGPCSCARWSAVALVGACLGLSPNELCPLWLGSLVDYNPCMTLETSALEDGLDNRAGREDSAPILGSEIDLVLTAQIVVGWAGEHGEHRRLGWWRTDMVSEFGGEDLLKRLLPHTWRWAVLQSVREAARLKDAELRAQAHDPDDILSLYNFGFEVDERIEDRFQELKSSGRLPEKALPGLSDAIEDSWNREHFLDWVSGHGEAEISVTPAGRCIEGEAPPSLDARLRQLVAGLAAPLGDAYPLPHFRKDAVKENTGRGEP